MCEKKNGIDECQKVLRACALLDHLSLSSNESVVLSVVKGLVVHAFEFKNRVIIHHTIYTSSSNSHPTDV